MRSRKILPALSLLTIFMLLTGCVTSSKKMVSIKTGMTREQVISVLGQPAAASADGPFEYLRFRLSGTGAPPLNPNAAVFADEYFVRFRDGTVDQFGKVGDFQSLDVNIRQE
ncbi:MAG: outer membrane protein assembly factor BamE [Verrucomicrobia bacterium]|nr:outer membrane protein assembly factor BamE [Verrucomicrobiota bacterium]